MDSIQIKSKTQSLSQRGLWFFSITHVALGGFVFAQAPALAAEIFESPLFSIRQNLESDKKPRGQFAKRLFAKQSLSQSDGLLAATSPTTDTDSLSALASPTTDTDSLLALASPTTDTDSLLAATSPTTDTDSLLAAASPTTDTDSLLAAASPTTDTDSLLAAASPTTDTDSLLAAASPTTDTDGLLAAASPTTDTDSLLAATSPTTDTDSLLAATSPTTDTDSLLAATSPTTDTDSLLAAASPAPPAKDNCSSVASFGRREIQESLSAYRERLRCSLRESRLATERRLSALSQERAALSGRLNSAETTKIERQKIQELLRQNLRLARSLQAEGSRQRIFMQREFERAKKNAPQQERLWEEQSALETRLRNAKSAEEREPIAELLEQNQREQRALLEDSSKDQDRLRQWLEREERGRGNPELNRRYTACQKTNDKFFLRYTEAEFCPDCEEPDDSPISVLTSAIEPIQWADFKERLRKRLLGIAALRMAYIRFMKDCARGEPGQKDILSRLLHPTDMSTSGLQSRISSLCERLIGQLTGSIKEDWPQMRLNLALSQEGRPRQGAYLGPDDSALFMDTRPQHKFWDLSALAPLSQQEIEKGKELYAQALLQALPNHEELRETIDSGAFRPRMLSDPVLGRAAPQKLKLKPDERLKLRQAVQALRDSSLQNYHEMIKDKPLLGLVKSEDPSPEELAKAFEKMEERAKQLLEDLKDPSTADESLLLAFKPLVEELLEEPAQELCRKELGSPAQYDAEYNEYEHKMSACLLYAEESPYCLAVERATARVSAQGEGFDWEILGASAAILPLCFLGPVGVAACAAGEAIIVGYELAKARQAVQSAWGQALLTGRELEQLAEGENILGLSSGSDILSAGEIRQDESSRNKVYSRLQDKEDNFDMTLLFAPLLLLEVPGILAAKRAFQKARQKGGGAASN